MNTNEEIVDLFNCVYRFKNKKGEIIYIGKASNLKLRQASHNHLPKECYEEKVKIEYVSFETNGEMDIAERYFIGKLKPKYNNKLKNKEVLFSIDLFENVEWNTYSDDKNKKSKIQLKITPVDIIGETPCFPNAKTVGKETGISEEVIEKCCNKEMNLVKDRDGTIRYFITTEEYMNRGIDGLNKLYKNLKNYCDYYSDDF